MGATARPATSPDRYPPTPDPLEDLLLGFQVDHLVHGDHRVIGNRLVITNPENFLSEWLSLHRQSMPRPESIPSLDN